MVRKSRDVTASEIIGSQVDLLLHRPAYVEHGSLLNVLSYNVQMLEIDTNSQRETR